MIAEADALMDKPHIFSLKLTGKLYAPEAGALEESIKDAVNSGAQHLILDCSKLDQIDSSALSAVIGGLKFLYVRTKGRIIFLKINEHIRRVLDLTKMTEYFPVADSLADAISAAEQSA